MEWNKTYGESNDDVMHAMVATSDGGYAMVGGSRLIKTDALGNVELNQTYEDYRFYSLVLTSDGGYAMAGNEVTESGSLGAWYILVKTDASGHIEWTKTYKETGFHAGVFKVLLVATSDGGYLLAGRKYKSDEYFTESDVWLVKTDEKGTIEWTQTYGRKYVDRANAVVEVSDRGYVIAGSNGEATGLPGDIDHKLGINLPPDMWLFKVDASGNMEWERTYGGDGWDVASALVATSDGGYAMAGTTDYHNCCLIKTDTNGVLEWNRTYDGESFNSLVQASDGGYVVAGRIYSTTGEDTDFWLMKTDELGISPNVIPDPQTQEPWDTNTLTLALVAVAIMASVAILIRIKQKQNTAS
jgi:hypothetical protein